MASICSVTRMLPSSLAIVLPARAVTTTAASTGASSRASASATTPPTIPSAENCRKPDDRAHRERHPGEQADEARR